jgi:predicted enzyme related to lactoylglutathione lyase
MPTMTKYEQGQFSWVELGTTDSAAAKKFYGGLFGWTFEDMPAGPDMVYTMAKLGNHHACALYKMGKDMHGVPPHWLSYVTVENVDQTTTKAKQNGGKAMKEPFDVMDVGRMAILTDPTGAHIALWQPKKHIGAGIWGDPGALIWNELFTNNVDAAGKFYSQTFGWKTQGVDMGPMGTYTLFSKDGTKQTQRGGMMNIPPNMKGAPPNWLAYFSSKDVDASCKKVKELGGNVLAEPMDIPGNIGRFAIVRDPQGAVFALFKPAQM